MKILKWLYPGIGIKRWLIFILLGLILFSAGIALLIRFNIISFLYYFLADIVAGRESLLILFASLLIIAGLLIIFWSFKRVLLNIAKNIVHEEEIVDRLYRKKILKKGPSIVAVGGGTGLSNLLRGLKKYTSNITAIVTVADDGGSSGRLRDELGMLPPGDIRNCLVALADTEPLMEQLFQYRFKNDGDLLGHSFGNLFIATMTEVLGDFEDAIKESSKVLAIRGQVLPSTNEDIRLAAYYEDSSCEIGESNIPVEGKRIKEVFLKPSNCQPTPQALNAIKNADIIVVGPGSLYTSIIPNLLVDGIPQAINESQARSIYICNVMTQAGETTFYSSSDHVKAIYDHVDQKIFDYIIVNKEKGSAGLARRYEAEGAFPVKVDKDLLKDHDLMVIEDELLADDDYLRHDPELLAEAIIRVLKGGDS